MKKINVKDLYIRDPFVFKENGIYYLTGSRGNQLDPTIQNCFVGFKSLDLINFEGPYILFESHEKNWKSNEYWAPEIHKYNGKYYLFGTIKLSDKCRGTYVFCSDSPLGEYKPLNNKPLTPLNWESLDGTLVIENDVPYLVFCHEWLQVRDGEIAIIQLSKDLSNSIGEPKILFKASDAKWVTPIFNDKYVTDGPFVYKYNEQYKMLWSSFYNDKYVLSIITSNNLFENWIQEKIPYLNDNSGHGMLFIDNDKVKLVYHSPNNPKGQERLKIIVINEFSKNYQIF